MAEDEVTDTDASIGEGLNDDSIGKSFRERAVVKSVSLRPRRGDVAGLLGPNGACKTTCFYMITGLIVADYGHIYLDGEDLTLQPMYQRARLGIGCLPQEAAGGRGGAGAGGGGAGGERRGRGREEAQA